MRYPMQERRRHEQESVSVVAGYLLASPIRRWMTDPRELLEPYVREGMTVLEPGAGQAGFAMTERASILRSHASVSKKE